MPRTAELIEPAYSEDTPVVYVNDNFGSWRSDQDRLVSSVLHRPHADLVEHLEHEVGNL